MKNTALKTAAYIYFIEGVVFSAVMAYAVITAGSTPDRIFYGLVAGGFALSCLIMSAKVLAVSRRPIVPNQALFVWGMFVTLFVGGFGGRWFIVAMAIPFVLVASAVHGWRHDA
jgi:hypothetical protein